MKPAKGMGSPSSFFVKGPYRGMPATFYLYWIGVEGGCQLVDYMSGFEGACWSMCSVSVPSAPETQSFLSLFTVLPAGLFSNPNTSTRHHLLEVTLSGGREPALCFLPLHSQHAPGPLLLNAKII